MKHEDIKVGGLDERGRIVLDIFWVTSDYVIYRHFHGISPHFSDDSEIERQQRKDYAEIGPLLAHVNALRSGVSWKTESIDREIARSISQSLDGKLENAKLIL